MADPDPTPKPQPNNKRNNNSDDYILSENCLSTLNCVINNKFGIKSYELKSECISVCGENSYGAILQLEIIPKKVTKSIMDILTNQLQLNESNVEPSATNTSLISDKRFYLIAKLSPKNPARRKAMKVVKYYQREIFIYRKILPQYEKIQLNNNIKLNLQFQSAPKFYESSLINLDEYLILEDLTQKGYKRYCRQKPLTYHHCNLALIELAKFHAMSFILRENNQKLYYELVDQIRYDNLFTDDIEPISIEFGKSYIQKTLQFIKQLKYDNNNNINNVNGKYILKDIENIIKNLEKFDNIFHELCVKLVNGELTEPYSVICHGDFWNNNILYKYDSENGLPIDAKVIDYQMARYASPVLDFVHYLFVCTEKSLRDQYFLQFKDIYHNTLTEHLKLFKLDANKIFPRYIFEKQLKSHGIYGFCMSIYAMPFYISDNADIPDLNDVSEAIGDLKPTEDQNINDNCKIQNSTNYKTESDNDITSKDNKNNNEKPKTTTDLLKNYEMLNDRTRPIYRQRMIGIVQDLEIYDFLKPISDMKLCNL